MKIYFSAAITQQDELGVYYQRIVNTLQKANHQIFQDTPLLTRQQAVHKSDRELTGYYEQTLKWIIQSDISVLEVSFPSTLYIGHEISLSLEKGHPVVGLYREDREPCFFLGRRDERLIFVPYRDDDLEESLLIAVTEAGCLCKTRFTMYLNRKLSKFLDYIAVTKHTPRAVFIRSLLEKEMAKEQFQP